MNYIILAVFIFLSVIAIRKLYLYQDIILNMWNIYYDILDAKEESLNMELEKNAKKENELKAHARKTERKTDG